MGSGSKLRMTGIGVALLLVASSVSTVAATGGVASAAKTKTTIAFDCPGTGAATLSPGIPTSGKAVKQTITFSGTDADCVNSAGTTATVPSSGTWTGTATGKTSCAALVTTGLKLKLTFSETFNDGTTIAGKGTATFPPATSLTDTGTFSIKGSGTIGKGSATGDLAFTLPGGGCVSGPGVSATIVITNKWSVTSKS